MVLRDFLRVLEHGTVISFYDANLDTVLYTGRTIIPEEEFNLQPHLSRRILAINTSLDDVDIELVLA